MTLLELNLTLDCGEEDFVCLAEGGNNLGASELSTARCAATAIRRSSRSRASSRARSSSTVRKPISVSELRTTSAVATGLIAELWNEEMPADEPAAAPASAADEADEADEWRAPRTTTAAGSGGRPEPADLEMVGLGVTAVSRRRPLGPPWSRR